MVRTEAVQGSSLRLTWAEIPVLLTICNLEKLLSFLMYKMGIRKDLFLTGLL